MMNRLQPFMRSSVFIDKLFDAADSQLDNKASELEDLRNQLDISTATWGLAYYENDLGIATDVSKSLDERRSAILAKTRSVGKITAESIKSVVGSWTGGECDVTFSDSTITITFISTLGIPSNMSDVEEIIKYMRPAHLGYEFIYNFNTNADLSGFTHAQLSSYTHEQLRSEVIT